MSSTTTTGRIDLKFGIMVHGPLRIIHTVFSNPLTLPLVPVP